MLWFQEHPPRYLLHCLLSLFTHCASEFCLFARALISWWWLSGSYTLRSWTERRHALTRSMHRLKADAMPVAWRSPALRFQLRSPHQAFICHRKNIPFLLGRNWERWMGWNGQHSTCVPHASRLIWASMGSNRINGRITLPCQQPHRNFESSLVSSFQLLGGISTHQTRWWSHLPSCWHYKEHWSRLRSYLHVLLEARKCKTWSLVLKYKAGIKQTSKFNEH